MKVCNHDKILKNYQYDDMKSTYQSIKLCSFNIFVLFLDEWMKIKIKVHFSLTETQHFEMKEKYKYETDKNKDEK